jgi:hypothetical protein
MVTAKPIVKNKFWILRDEQRKVGTVEKSTNGFILTMNNQQSEYKTITKLKNDSNITFEEFAKQQKKKGFEVHGFLTKHKPYNGIYNVQDRLPIYTANKKSKSWYAAGYYQITINGKTKVHFCPKVILLKRYSYIGPVKSPDGFTYL